MKITLYEGQDLTSLLIEFYDSPPTFSIEMQKGLIYRYDENLNLVKIEVQDPQLVKTILKELQEVLRNSDVKIIKKAA